MPARPEDAPTYFVDRSLGGNIVVNALRNAGAEVKAHDDLFEIDALDEEWLQHCGMRGWIVLSKDPRIMRNPLERAALARSGVAAFFLRRGDLSGPEMARAFVNALPRIGHICAKYLRPVIGVITPKGKVTVKSGEKRGAKKRSR